MNKITTKNFVRISKREAEKRYNRGETIRLVPCKIDPENLFGISYDCSIDDWGMELWPRERRWKELLIHFEWYNCGYNEWGRYPAYYIRKEMV